MSEPVVRMRTPSGTGNGHSADGATPSASSDGVGHDGAGQDGAGRDGGHGAVARDARDAAVLRLVSAATRLASTIAVTEELSQRRAELLRTRDTIVTRRLTEPSQAPLVSLAEAAKRTGRHPEVLRRWCIDGRIPAVRVGRTWAISPETVRALLAQSSRSRPRFPTSDRV
jgi:excisionase family DNA binding protein